MRRVLITGGSEGIGRGLAVRYFAAGSMVRVSGRSRVKLDRAAHDHPGLRVGEVHYDVMALNEIKALSGRCQQEVINVCFYVRYITDG